MCIIVVLREYGQYPKYQFPKYLEAHAVCKGQNPEVFCECEQYGQYRTLTYCLPGLVVPSVFFRDVRHRYAVITGTETRLAFLFLFAVMIILEKLSGGKRLHIHWKSLDIFFLVQVTRNRSSSVFSRDIGDFP